LFLLINYLKKNRMKKLSLFLIFAFISIFNANAQPPMPNISTTTSYQYYTIKNMRGGTYYTDMGVNVQISASALTANNPAQLWRIVETASGSGVYYITSKNGRSMYYDSAADRFKAGAAGNSFTFVRSANSTYLDSWEINGGGGPGNRVNANGSNVGSYYPDDGGNPVTFTYVETITIEAITAEIDIADVLYGVSKQGLNPGNYTASARTTFATAITNAKAVRDNGAATPTEKDNATAALVAAESAYKATKLLLQISDATHNYWYFLKAPRGPSGQLFLGLDVDNNIAYNAQSLVPAQMWKVITNGTGGYSLLNQKDETLQLNTLTPNDGVTIVNMVGGEVLYDLSTVEPLQNDMTSGNDMFVFETDDTDNTSGTTFRIHAGHDALLNYSDDRSDFVAFQMIVVDGAQLLSDMIAEAQVAYLLAGPNPGQYAIAEQTILGDAISVAINLSQDSNATNDAKLNAAATLDAAKTAYLASTINPIKDSTASTTVWYAIKCYARSPNNYLKDNGVGTTIIATSNAPLTDGNYWKFEDLGGGEYKITSKLGNQILIPAANSTAIPSTTADQVWQIGSLGAGQFKFTGSSSFQLHLAGGSTGLVTYPGGANTASAFYLEELETPLGVKNANYTNRVVLYPNPAKNTVAIKLPTALATAVEITNVLGQTVSRSSYNATDLININVAGLANGLYFVKVTNNEIREVSKLVITN
jgi:hypothetical protein